MKLALTIRQMTAFGLTGLASVGLILILTAFLHEVMGVNHRTAYAVALASALVFNFCINRQVVFRGSDGRALPQFMVFVLASLVFRSLEYAGYLLMDATLKPNYLINIILVQGISFFIKFCFYRYVVFTKRTERDAADTDGRQSDSRSDA